MRTAGRLERPARTAHAHPSPPALVESSAAGGELNLDYAATTPALRVAIDAVTAFLPDYGSVHRGGGRRSTLSTEAYESARESVASFVASPAGSSVIFVRNTTEAANLLSAALRSGSRVLCSPFEHHANLLPWRSHDVRYLPFTRSEADFLEVVETSLRQALDAGRPIDLLAVTGASNVSGEVTPIAALARLAHDHGARIFVDAAQLAPHRPIDVGALDVDFLAFSGHKLYAPFGTGALIARDEALRDGLPLLHGGGAVRLVSLDDVAWGDVPHRYEAGTPNTVGAIALGAACRALRTFGMERLSAIETAIAEPLWEGLRSVPGVSLLQMWEDARDRVGVATFAIEGIEPQEVARGLASDWGIAVRSGAFCAHPLVAYLLGVSAEHTRRLFDALAGGGEVRVPGAVRASIGLGVTRNDIDVFLDAVHTLAAGGR
jgi:selenocysteine lyase/cysteine desulfurase